MNLSILFGHALWSMCMTAMPLHQICIAFILLHRMALQLKIVCCMQILQTKLDKLKENRPGNHLGAEQQELETLRTMVRCSLCNVRSKRSVITRCMHMFCEECLAQWQAKRHRNCPSCKTGFSAQDVKQIYLV